MHFIVSFMIAGLIWGLLFGLLGDTKEYTITVSDGIIEGPSKKDANQRISFAIDHLDRIATSNRSFFQKINMERILYSIEGEKIVLNETVFSPTQIRGLLQRLNVAI